MATEHEWHPHIVSIFKSMSPWGRMRVDIGLLTEYRAAVANSRGDYVQQLMGIYAAAHKKKRARELMRSWEDSGRLGSRRLLSSHDDMAFFSQRDTEYIALFSEMISTADPHPKWGSQVRGAFQPADPSRPAIIDAQLQQYIEQDRLIRQAEHAMLFTGLSLFHSPNLEKRLERLPLFPDHLHPALIRKIKEHRERGEVFTIDILLVDPFSHAGRALAQTYRPDSRLRDPLQTALRTIAAFRGAWRNDQVGPNELRLRLTDRVIPSVLSIDQGAETMVFLPGLDDREDRFPGLLFKPAHLYNDTETASVPKEQRQVHFWSRLEKVFDIADQIPKWERNQSVENRSYFARTVDDERRSLVFSYGRSMREAQMKKLCPTAVRFGVAILEAHARTYPRQGTDAKHAVVSLAPKEGSQVFGVVWSVTRRELEALDKQENPEAYQRQTFEVRAAELRVDEDDLSAPAGLANVIFDQLIGALMQVEAYVALPQIRPGHTTPPIASRYLVELTQGAMEAGFSELACWNALWEPHRKDEPNTRLR